MALTVIRLLQRESDAPRKRIFAMAGISGAAVTLAMVVVNMAADQIAAGQFSLKMPLIFVILWSIHNLGQRYSSAESVRAVETGLRRVRLRVADKIRRCELRFVEEENGITAFSPLLRDAGMLSQGVLLLVRGMKAVLLLISAGIYLFWVSPPSALALFLVLGVLVAFLLTHYRVTAVELTRADQQDAHYTARLADMLDGFKELQTDRRASDGIAEELVRLSHKTERVRRASNRRQIRETLLSEGASYLVLALVVFVVPALVAESTTTVLTVTATAFFLMGPVLNLASALPMMAQVDAAIGALYNLEERLDAAVAVADGLPPVEGLREFKRIELEGVRFRYVDDAKQTTFAVGPIDLTLHGGELLFIVGGNGSGKSTLLKLLTGLYRPDAGQVRLDGHALVDAERPRYRTLFATVFTDFHLFQRLYSLPDLDPAEVERRLAELGLAEKTRYSEQGFSNLKLSTGQKKRIALLSALLKERPIVVLDEMAADQDPTFRRHFYEEMLPALKAQGLTLVCVTHDDHYFHIADRVLTMREGRLVQLRASPPPERTR